MGFLSTAQVARELSKEKTTVLTFRVRLAGGVARIRLGCGLLCGLVAGIGPSLDKKPRGHVSFLEIWGLRGLGDGLKLRTHHPVIEPVSTGAGNGNFLRGDRPAKAGPSAGRDGLRDAPEARKPRSPRINCEITCEGPNPETGWWAHQGSNLGPDD